MSDPVTLIPAEQPNADTALRESHWSDIELREAYCGLRSVLDSIPSFDVADGVGYPAYGAYHPPVPQDNRKVGENIPVYLDEAQLKAIRDRSRVLYATNEYCIGAVKNRVNYVVGEGFSYHATPRNAREQQHKRSAEAVQKIINEWSEINDISEMEAEALTRADVDGEFFIRTFLNEDGFHRLRFVEPEHVKSPAQDSSDPSNSFGCITKPDDVVTVLGYWIVDDPTQALNPEKVPAEEVLHFKANSSSAAKRGIPTFYPVESVLRKCEALQSAMTACATARAKVAIICKIKGLTNNTADQLANRLAETRITSNFSGKSTTIENWKEGSILRVPEGSEYEMPSASMASQDIIDALQAGLRAVAAMLSMPEWMLTALADAKYDNSFISEAPTLKSFSRLRRKLCKAFGESQYGPRASLLWRQLRSAVETGMLTREDLSNVNITCTGPSLEARDREKEVGRHRAMVDAGFESIESAQRALSLDPEVEVPLITHNRAGKARPVTDLVALSQYQQAYYGGALPREAALSALVVVLGYDRKSAEALLPEKPSPEPEPKVEPQQTQATLPVVEQQRHEYATTHVLLSGDLAERVLCLAAQVRDEDLAEGGRETVPHITCRYGLHDSDPPHVANVLSQFSTVSYTLGAVSCFLAGENGGESDVVKVEVDSPDLHRLNAALAALPHTDTHPEYKPHATIAYVKAGLGESYAKRFAPLNLSGEASEVVYSDCRGNKTILPLHTSASHREVPT